MSRETPAFVLGIEIVSLVTVSLVTIDRFIRPLHRSRTERHGRRTYAVSRRHADAA